MASLPLHLHSQSPPVLLTGCDVPLRAYGLPQVPPPSSPNHHFIAPSSLSSHSSSVHEDQAEVVGPVPFLTAALRSARATATVECIMER
jgi:hypothetical protein